MLQVFVTSKIKIKVSDYLKARKAKTMQKRLNAVVNGYFSKEELAKITLSEWHAKKYNQNIITNENIQDILCKNFSFKCFSA